MRVFFSQKKMVGNNWRYEKLCRMIEVMKISVE
jgi:hypothetical protein